MSGACEGQDQEYSLKMQLGKIKNFERQLIEKEAIHMLARRQQFWALKIKNNNLALSCTVVGQPIIESK